MTQSLFDKSFLLGKIEIEILSDFQYLMKCKLNASPCKTSEGPMCKLFSNILIHAVNVNF